MAINIVEVEKAIGYKFKNNDLLIRAFTHNSIATEKGKSYQNLEFLGDSILDFIIAKYFFEKFSDKNEGHLTRLRANVVSEKPLATAIDRLNISHNMMVGIGEKKQNITQLDSVKSDLFESLVGAIYLDSNCIQTVEEFILKTLKCEIESATTSKVLDSKSELNEYATKHSLEVDYELLSEVGPDHSPEFRFKVLVDGKDCGVGTGKTKREAQQVAAKNALDKIKQKKQN